MPELKKVITGLECCILRDPDDHARCSQCSYESNCVNRLKMDALELLKAQEPKWISVKDRLPEKPGTYLCYQPKAADICALNTVRWSTQRGWMGKEVGSRIEGIEYWMPLPEPPKEE